MIVAFIGREQIMKEAIILTDKPIDPRQCKEVLSKTISEINGNDNAVSFGKEQKSLYIWFPSIATEDESEKFIFEDLTGIPVGLSFATHLEYHRDIELKKTVEQLQLLHPELYVIDNDDHVFSAKEYLTR